MAIALKGYDMFGLDALQQASLERLVKYLEAADAAGATSFPNIPEDMLFAFGRDEKRAVHNALKYAWENQTNFGGLDNRSVYQGFGGATLAAVTTLVDEQLRNGELGLLDSRNLFLWTQDFTNVYWDKFNTTITANNTIAPDGTMTAERFAAANTGSSTHVMDADSVALILQGETASCSVYNARSNLSRLTTNV